MATINYDFYKGEDLYSDGMIENDMLEIAANNDDLNSYANASHNWPIFYHFSNQRKNVLYWYDFAPNADILEVGSGCGAITGLLCSKAKSVTGVDLSKKRTAINYERNKTYDNLELIVGDINDVQFNKKFDYITLIGVLEYASCFSDEENPYAFVLNKLKNLLNPGGKIIIAIENRFGIKYFSGAPEDHTGEYFDSINGYPNTSIRTFSKNELLELLSECGLSNNKFYYALPDYKFPTSIYTNAALQAFPAKYHYELSNNGYRINLFNENEVLSSFTDSQIVDHFMNSFIVECSENEIKDNKFIYAKFCSERHTDFVTYTKIVSDGEKYSVEKHPLSENSKKHLKNMYDYSTNEKAMNVAPCTFDGEKLTMEYINGETLTSVATSFVKENNKASFLNVWDSLYSSIKTSNCSIEKHSSEEFKKIFGKNDFSENMECVSPANYDLILDNIIIKGEKTYIIDYEWTFNFKIPVKFIMWYSIYHFYMLSCPNANKLVLMGDLFEKYNISSNLIELFTSWTNTFKDEYINDMQVRRNHEIMQIPLDLKVALANTPVQKPFISTLYYSKTGYFTEASALQVKYTTTQDYALDFDIPNDNKFLRFDPIEGEVCICKNIKAFINNVEVEMLPNNALERIDGNDIFLNYDPMYIIKVPEKILLTAHTHRTMHVHITCEFFIDDLPYAEKLSTQWMLDKAEKIRTQGHIITQNELLIEEQFEELNKEKQLLEISNCRLNSTNENYNLILNSFSWKITAPIRAAIRVIKKVFKKQYVNTHTSIIYSIDVCKSINQNGYIRGWALDTADSTSLLINIILNDEVTLYTFRANEIRNDVKTVFSEYIHPRFSGFNLELLFKTSKISRIEFVNPKTSTKYVIADQELQKIKLANNKNKFLSKALRNIVAIKNLFAAGKRIFITNKNFSLNPSTIKMYLFEIAKLFKNSPAHIESDYTKWINEFEPSKKELEAQKQFKFKKAPLISFVTPTYNTPPEYMTELIKSLQEQTYSNWEICLADGGSNEQTKHHIKKLMHSEKRIKAVFLDENRGIAGNTTAAIEISSGEYIALIDHDDVVAPFALFEIVNAINNDERVDFIYSDEDKLMYDDRVGPYFKPDWSPELFETNNYLCHLTAFKRSLYEKTEGYDNKFNGAQDFDLFLKLTEKAEKIVHIPKILYHWRCHQNSTAMNPDSKSYAVKAGLDALIEHFKRINVECDVKERTDTMFRYISKPIPSRTPLVSIIIPNKDGANYLEKCIGSILGKSTYSNYEIIIVENNSIEAETFELYERIVDKEKVKLITWSGVFNYSAINNFAIKQCNGEYIILLNNDTKVITPDWIENMLGHAMREGVGAVGAKLYYSDKTLQHVGIVLGKDGVAGYLMRGIPNTSTDLYYNRAVTTCDVSAVTAACMMIPRKVLEEVNYFEEDLKVAFNDVDLCLKINSCGYRIVWSAETELYHFESKTRGYEDTPEKQNRFLAECKYMAKKWGDIINSGDKYYSINFSLHRGDFVYKSTDEPLSLQPFLDVELD